MDAKSRTGHSSLGQIAERQMRIGAISLEVFDRLGREKALATLPTQTHPYVCISREAGAGGEEVASALALELNWQLLDRELVHYIAERGHLSETMLQRVDEGQWNWLVDLFGGWMQQRQQRSINQAGYVLRLGEVLLAATRHAPSVIVGRGAQNLLPRERGIVVRIVAPQETRIRRVMQQRCCNYGEAATFVKQTDAVRDEFVHRIFHQDPHDPHAYDLVVNTDAIDVAASASLVASACRQRFPQAQPMAS